MNINLYIERLVLDGLPYTASEGEALGVALQAELARLLGQGGLPSLAPGGSMPRLDGGAISVAPRATAPSVGQQLAQPILGALRA